MKQQIFVVKKEEVVSIGDHRRLQLWSTVFADLHLQRMQDT